MPGAILGTQDALTRKNSRARGGSCGETGAFGAQTRKRNSKRHATGAGGGELGYTAGRQLQSGRSGCDLEGGQTSGLKERRELAIEL